MTYGTTVYSCTAVTARYPRGATRMHAYSTQALGQYTCVCAVPPHVIGVWLTSMRTDGIGWMVRRLTIAPGGRIENQPLRGISR